MALILCLRIVNFPQNKKSNDPNVLMGEMVKPHQHKMGKNFQRELSVDSSLKSNSIFFSSMFYLPDIIRHK